MIEDIINKIKNMKATELIEVVDTLAAIPLIQKIEQLKADNEKLRECVEFYAHDDYEASDYIECISGEYIMMSDEFKKLARQTLKEIGGRDVR